MVFIGKLIDITGQKFGMLTAVEHTKTVYGKGSIWKFKCDCGNIVERQSSLVRNGNIKSCGCLNAKLASERCKHRNTKHGYAKDKLYSIWKQMKRRCISEKCKDYKNYGGRGISVCKSWMCSYEEFKDWSLQSGYSQGLSIDRIDVNGNYEPSNCRWATAKEQENNKRKIKCNI